MCHQPHAPLFAFGTVEGKKNRPLTFSTFPQVNIIPIIAKADTISKSELHKFKIKIMSELVSNGVQIYQFPTDDEAVSEINASMNVSSTPWKWSMSCFLLFFCFFFKYEHLKYAERQDWWHFYTSS